RNSGDAGTTPFAVPAGAVRWMRASPRQGSTTVSPPPPILFKDCTAVGLHARLAPDGVDARLARRLPAAVLRGDLARAPAALPEVPRRLLEHVRQRTTVPRLTLLDRAVSPADGFTKYLFWGDGDGEFEAVRIPLLHRPGKEKYVVCVSSQ